MADDKEGREKQARDEENRQRKRQLEEDLARGDEPEPAAEGDDLAVLDAKLDEHDYPASAGELVEAYGDYEVRVRDDSPLLHEVLRTDTDREFDSADEVRAHIDELLG